MGPEALDPNAHRVLIEVVATWVLLAVFAMSALAFVCTIFGVLKPDKITKKFLYGVFSVSSVGVFVGVAADFLRADLNLAATDIAVAKDRQEAAEIVRKAEPVAGVGSPITVYTQVAASKDKETYAAVKSILRNSRFIVPAVDVVNFNISRTEIRYCNPENEPDAKALEDKLEASGLGHITSVRIQKCDPQKNKNILELWLEPDS